MTNECFSNQHETIKNPYNIQPLGNIYFSGIKSIKPNMGFFSMLDDSLVQKILVKLGPFNTIKLSMTCRALYIHGYHDDIWRHFTVQSLKEFKENWRTSFKLIYNTDYVKDQPIRVDGFYSDLLYSFWRCTLCDLTELTNPTIETVDRVSDLSFEQFKSKYLDKNVPCIITDVVKNWEASKWSFESFLKTNNKYQAEEATLSFDQYYQYMNSCNEESPLYLFDSNISHLQQYKVPEYFKSDLFSLLPNRPDYRWLIVGPKRSGSTFHLDPNSTSAWNAVIKGSKKWILFPPGVTPPGVFPSEDGGEVTTPLSIVEWFINYYNQIDKQMKCLECVVNEGEMIFIPNRWWHSVINLEDTIALTQNFVNEENLPNVLKFLKMKEEQVSGYCGENLYEDFARAIRENRDDLTPVLDEFELKLYKKRKWDTLVEESAFCFGFGN